jgi:hypothetical protein
MFGRPRLCVSGFSSIFDSTSTELADLGIGIDSALKK